MANGEFLQGISRGIFGEQEKMRKEQESKDEKRKGQIIELLSSLAPNVEPESLPLLMGHLGDVIGIKGKMRKFWDVFSGQPDMSPEAQMGDIVRNVSSQLTGSETAKQARETYKGELLQPFRSQGTRPRSVEALPYKTPPSLANKIVFRDPRAEKLEELESRYGLQFANQQAQTAYKESLMTDRMRRLEEERQTNRLELERERADSRAEREVREEAFLNARGQGRGYLTPTDWSVGVRNVARRNGLDEKLLRTRIGVGEATIVEKQAIAKSIDESGMKPGEAGRLDLSRKNFYDDQAKEYSFNLGQLRGAEAQIKVIKDAQQKQAEQIRARVATGEITKEAAETSIAFLQKKDADRLGTAEGKKAEALTKAQSAYNKLKDPENVYYSIGEFGTDITSTKKAVRPPKPGPKAGIGTARRQVTIPVTDPGKYEVGGTFNYAGRKHKVLQIKGNFVIATPE